MLHICCFNCIVMNKVGEKLKAAEVLLESKNLEIKTINEEKGAALAAQFAAEATLRRVHATQKDDEMPPIDAIIVPLEAELKLARMEVAKLQDDNRALDLLTKSKEAGLLEAEIRVQIALAEASLVDDLQNKNQELMKLIEICQDSLQAQATFDCNGHGLWHGVPTWKKHCTL
ncbi:hypothetical protein PHAVU_010G075840 [Phaseolus vulgaris]|uniref:microtubule-associated protein 70-1-like isoform X3 n=2 Tax=Phaseolus vulgaris TaxID=3885 RepID=UPI0035CC3E91